MKTKQKIIFAMTLIISLCLGYVSAYGYVIAFNKGFDPSPAYIKCYSGMTTGQKTAVHNACVEWNTAGHGNVVYRTTADHSNTIYEKMNYENQITLGNRGANTYVMATTFQQTYNPLPWIYFYIWESDIDVNTYFTFSTAASCPSNAHDFQHVVTHEIGHLLGLGEEPSEPSSTMNQGMIMGSINKRTLETDDKDGLGDIY